MIRSTLACVIVWLSPGVAWGEKAAESGVEGVTADTIVETLLALLLVVVAILASTWLIKRLNPRLRKMQAGGNINVADSFALSNRERLMIVNVDGQRLLLGVTSGSISLIKDLTGLAESAVSEESPSTMDKTLFQRLLKR